MDPAISCQESPRPYRQARCRALLDGPGTMCKGCNRNECTGAGLREKEPSSSSTVSALAFQDVCTCPEAPFSPCFDPPTTCEHTCKPVGADGPSKQKMTILCSNQLIPDHTFKQKSPSVQESPHHPSNYIQPCMPECTAQALPFPFRGRLGAGSVGLDSSVFGAAALPFFLAFLALPAFDFGTALDPFG